MTLLAPQVKALCSHREKNGIGSSLKVERNYEPDRISCACPSTSGFQRGCESRFIRMALSTASATNASKASIGSLYDFCRSQLSSSS